MKVTRPGRQDQNIWRSIRRRHPPGEVQNNGGSIHSSALVLHAYSAIGVTTARRLAPEILGAVILELAARQNWARRSRTPRHEPHVRSAERLHATALRL